ncbi:hypothetical protein ACN26Y_11940 [Micromonospora sp. WMMD558]|uniref:hypothetical protein n=1 Tax=unclassified Micromonospora TaxID=2617518 RepID=UPI0012B4F42D|nr:hypothetical protein [Micromonospora sp. WMMC415]QGN46943.1 hypothetical protein GKC29_08830 [Micromonospora sp. WMMC415]
MDEDLRPRAVWPEVVGVVAAAAVGLVVAADGFPLAVFAVFTEILVRGPMGPGVYATAVLAAAIAVPALLPRLPGWLVAAAGLAVYLAASLTTTDLMMRALLPIQVGTTREVALALAATAGLGLALGGVLLAVAQASPTTSWWTGAGLAAGLVLHPVGTDLFVAVSPPDGTTVPSAQPGVVRPGDLMLWLALGLVVVAAVVTYVRGSGRGMVGPARFRPGAPVAVIAVTALFLVGLALRMGMIRAYRPGPDEIARPDRAAESFAQVSAVVLAAVAALLLAAYAYRLGRARAARWVVLGAAAAPIVVFTFPHIGRSPATRTALVLLLGLGAVAGGALAGRYAARLLPWDALGLVVAAAATALTWPAPRAELPSSDTVGPALVAVGLGLALGSGIVLVTGPAGPPPAREAGMVNGDGAGVLVLGPATLMLCATALAPVMVRSQAGDVTGQESSFTLPLFTTVGAVLLVVLFGFARAVDRPLPDRSAEPAASAT